jgi:hypothetical protein
MFAIFYFLFPAIRLVISLLWRHLSIIVRGEYPPPGIILGLWDISTQMTEHPFMVVILERCAANITQMYFKNEKKPICIEICIHSLKYINIFLILYTKCVRTFVYVLQCAANQKSFRTISLWSISRFVTIHQS